MIRSAALLFRLYPTALLLRRLQPGTNPPIGQSKAREQKQLIFLEPGEKRYYELIISVLTQKEQIKDGTCKIWKL
jgi:hypothetical protein